MATIRVVWWILWAVITDLPYACSKSLVVVNSGIQVARGKAIFVTEKELKMNVDQIEESCKVEVVLNEPITQRVGKLTPQVFDCQFPADVVKYVHNGSPILKEDTVMLRVYRFTLSETFIETIILTVSVIEPKESLVELGSTQLVVPQFYGLSNIIEGSVLTISSRANMACTVRLTSESSFPALGRLVIEEDSESKEGKQRGVPCPGNKPCPHGAKGVGFFKASCQEFLTSGLKYQHLSPPSPEIDYIPIRVELRHQTSRALLETENVWLPVLIQEAVQNQPPHAAFMASFILEVDQFILTPLTTAALDAKDHETPQEKLLFNVTVPPTEGYITHLDDHTKPSHSFTWTDLHEMRVAYQPPNSSHTSRRNFEVEFQAIDGFYVASPPIMVHFSIRIAETNAPRVSWNMGLDLLEGQSRPITWENLQIVDNDNLQAVSLVAVDGPMNGHLRVRGGKAFMLRVRDLQEGVVVYQHSDSDTTCDHIVFRITDGVHSIRHKFPINVLPKDDTPAFLINNVAVEVEEGGSVLLEEYMLLASDLDSSDDYILFQLVTFPQAGELVKKSSPHLAGVPVKSFLQRDLSQGLIYYSHSGEESFQDSFDFILLDNHQPPNPSHKHTMVVHVFPVKDQLPVEVPGSVRSLKVKETEVVYLTQAHLHFIDKEQPNAYPSYTITQPCSGLSGSPDAGRLFYTDSASAMKKDHMVPVLKSFTQHAVNHMKVAYMPPMEDIGPEPLLIQFVFSVNDQHGGSISGLVFNITVTPVDNQTPEVFTNLLRVEEGGEVFVTEEHLLIRDRDSVEEALLMVVQKQPLHGRMELQGRQLQNGDSFSLQDIRALKLRYIHDDSETVEDSVFLTVADGVNSADAVLSVEILQVNDEPPQLGQGLRGGLSCEEGGQVQVTLEYLSASDVDSDDDRLIYMLARTPFRGELQRSGVTVDKFSQRDVLQGHIYYLHTGGEIGPDPVSDSVTLIVSDGEAGASDSCCHGDVPPPPVPLHGTLPVYDLNVTVLPVNNKAPTIITGDVLVVDEGSSACLCGGVLRALDPDTHTEQLTFYVESPPQHGFLESTLPSPGFEKSNAGLRVAVFSLEHLLSGYIQYVQGDHQGVEPTIDQFTISVRDGVHQSALTPFYIIITPMNDEPPTLLLANFTVKEGGMKELTPALLNGFDLDKPSDLLTFTVVKTPAHGSLLNGIYGMEPGRYKDLGTDLLHRSLPVHTFTMTQLLQGTRIMYMHDDTETLEDVFAVQLTDGVHSVQRAARVHVLPANDQEPRLLNILQDGSDRSLQSAFCSINAGMEVESLKHRVISSVVLEAVDLDNPSSQIYYILNAGPRFGKLQLKNESGWTELGPGQNFTQEDVELNHLWYTHTTITGFKGHDSIRFYLSDTANESPPQTFFISIHTNQKGDIALVTKPVTLLEGERVVLTTDVLSATDTASQPEELVYSVSVPPKHGHIHAVQRPGQTLLSFTQLDVAANRVCYTHDNSHLSPMDSLSFVITNGAMSRSGYLHFTIEHGDHIPPTLHHNHLLHLAEGTLHTITAEHLELTDPDTSVGNLTYIITQLPQFGKLLLRGSPLSELRFTQTDISNGDVAYQHTSVSSAELDRFHFLPSDGRNRGYLEYGQLREEPQPFTIQVDRVDKNPPSLTTKQSPSTVDNVEEGRQGIYITSRHLQASDPDSPTQDLEYIITRQPHFGYLENTLTGSYIKGRFTQKDVNQRAVLYILPTDMEVTGDSIEFRLTDPAGNTILPETLELVWSRIQLSSTCYKVCENAGTLSIQIERRGKSSDPAYVAIQLTEGTAKVGQDYTHSSASLIQFDQGVNLKTWNIYLIDDGLEENHETFNVILKAPKNTVLGQQTSAIVEVIDPRGGRCVPEDLQVEEDEERSITAPLVPPHLPSGAKEDPVTEIETELLWESQPLYPRGDVPERSSYLDHSKVDPQHQAAPRLSQHQAPRKPRISQRTRPETRVHRLGKKTKIQEKVWTFHSLTPLRLEERQVLHTEPVQQRHPDLQVTPFWNWPSHSLLDGVQGRETSSSTLHQVPLDDVRGRETSSSTLHQVPLDDARGREALQMDSSSTPHQGRGRNKVRKLFQSNLTSVRSKNDMAWLWKFAGRKPFWIGLSGSPGHWRWNDGSVVSFSKLKPAKSLEFQPDRPTSCVLVESPRKWTPLNCATDSEHKYICLTQAQTLQS
ncbi:FRAS1-related extracellular matrix protein 1b [Aplochiton taeniatus]